MSFGVPNIIGKAIDVVTDKLGLPEPLGDAVKIGAGIVMGNGVLIADGIADIAPDVLDFVAKELDLGQAEPDSPERESSARRTFEETLRVLQRELQRDGQCSPSPAPSY